MIKRSTIVLLLSGSLFACNQTQNKQDQNTAAQDTQTIVKDTPQKAAVTDTLPATSTEAVTADKLIIPGKGIGHILLNDDAQKVITQLGRPDSSDAAMGSALMVWFAKHDPSGYRTAIFARHNMGGKNDNISFVKKILITSPWFKTAESLGVGSTMADIKKQYTLKPTSTYDNKGSKVQVYTDLAKGISFEIDETSNKCVGVVVHSINDSATAYLNMH